MPEHDRPADSPAGLLADLARVAGALGPAVRPPGADDLLASMTETTRRLFGAQACSLALLSADESELVYTAAAGVGAESVIGMRLPSGRGVAGWVAASGQPVAIDDLQGDPRFARDVAEGTGYVPRAMLAVPVESSSALLGVMTLLDRDAGRPGAQHDIALLSLFAGQAALAVEAVRAVDDVGRVLLGALAVAAGAGSTLAAALTEAVDELPDADADLAELAVLLGDLARSGEAERRLAVRVVTEVTRYATVRHGSR